MPAEDTVELTEEEWKKVIQLMERGVDFIKWMAEDRNLLPEDRDRISESLDMDRALIRKLKGE